MNDQCLLKYEDLLPLVRKPSQYMGGEINAIKKDLDKVKTVMALVFPDMYAIGMSHQGLKILYHIVNKNSEYAAERVFSPDLDYEELLRGKGMPLGSLENKIPLNKFDIVGFTFPYEMSYSNILNILDLGHIPLLKEDRAENKPLVIGGGPCAFNPEPLADFFDCFIVGDGEEVVLEILSLYSDSKMNNESKNDLLQRMAEIKGVYVPSMFRIEYFEEGQVKNIHPENNKYRKINKRILLDLNKVDYPIAPVIPFTKLIHDRVSIEIDRGCTEACRFCQAGFTYRPVRERSVEKILEISKCAIDLTGYGEISLLSLSSGDYSEINTLVPELMGDFLSSHISLSLPSLQPRTLKKGLIDCLGSAGKTGYTLAIEAGSQRLRNILNKKITEKDIFMAVENISLSGTEMVKLYFMIGLPTETYEDLEEIYLICKKIFSKAKKMNPRFKKLNIGFSFFVPKPHTPFQWIPQDNLLEMQKKLDFLKRKFSSRAKYKIKWQNPKLSFLEAVFARGDRRLGKVLLNAFKLGCKFDGWSDQFDYDRWMKAFKKSQVDPAFYAQRNISKFELFPWDLIDIGVKKEYLLKEYLRSNQEFLEDDCRKGKCLICGLENVCPNIKKIEKKDVNGYTKALDVMKTKKQMENGTAIFKYRIQFTKMGITRFLSHAEISVLLIRILRRAKLPVYYSKGFHPRPKISFDFALPVGMESKSEFFDVLLTEEMSPDFIRKRLNNQTPNGMEICLVTKISLNSKPLPLSANKIFFTILIERPKTIPSLDLFFHEQRLAKFLSQDKINLKDASENSFKEASFRRWFDKIMIQSLTPNSLILELVAKVHQGKLISPHKVLETLYPELKYSRGNYRMVKEATSYV